MQTNELTLPTSVHTTAKQTKTFRKTLHDGSVAVVEVQWDDTCENGHNTFSVTCDLYDRSRNNGDASTTNANGKRRWLGSCGCQHDLVTAEFPELAHLIQWHLVSSDGPMHYIANTTYHAGKGLLEYARSNAVWPDGTLEQLADVETLKARLPELMQRFKAVVESVGFTY